MRPLGSEGRAPAVGFDSPASVVSMLEEVGYIADRALATCLFLSQRLGLPVLLEGEPGVGKTEVAKALAEVTDRRLIRLQCYEGIDSASAIYDWDYPRQLLHMRRSGDTSTDADIFSDAYLVSRPLLEAVRAGDDAVLLVDEVDRADEAFEAFMLEFLSEFQITIPEIGTVRAQVPPIVILTSNRTRDLHDALRRRCLYHWIDYPTIEREMAILRVRAPGLPHQLVADTARAVAHLRALGLFKAPGVSETLEWARALAALGYAAMDSGAVEDTLGVVLKDHDDIVRLSGNLTAVVNAARRE